MNTALHRRDRRGPRSARGVGLLDALIALAILTFGLLGMSRMQTSLVRQGSESQARLSAAQLGDELLSTVLVDLPNVGCYTLPDAAGCASVAARARAEDWNERVLEALPGEVETAAAVAGGRFTVTINWTGKDSGETRTLEATTDVRD
jgi:type IV pilus assembly protein PilV